MSESNTGATDNLDGIEFRNCTSNDIPALLELWRASGSLPTATDSPKALQTKLRRDPELFVLAYDGDGLVGCLMGGFDGWRANMYRLAVLPGYRRRGIGQRLVRLVEQRFRELGAVRLYALAVKPEIEPAAADFWLAMGYELNPRTRPYVRTLE